MELGKRYPGAWARSDRAHHDLKLWKPRLYKRSGQWYCTGMVYPYCERCMYATTHGNSFDGAFRQWLIHPGNEPHPEPQS